MDLVAVGEKLNREYMQMYRNLSGTKKTRTLRGGDLK